MISQNWWARVANVAIIFVSTAFMFVVSELALRMFYPQQLGVWHQTRDGLAIHRPNSTVKFFNHEIYINSLGMRDREHTIRKKDGTFRILLLGDSFMEALQVPFDESFPKLLEDRLRESGLHDVEVINAAVSGWGTEDELAYLVRYGKRLEPDLILVAMTLHNDVSDNMREQFYTLHDGQLQAKPVRETPTKEYLVIRIQGFIASHSHLYQLWRKYWYRGDIQNTGRLLNNHVANLLASSDTEQMARGWQLTYQELATIQMEGRRIGAETTVILIPLALQLSKDRLVKLSAENKMAQHILDRKPQDTMISFAATQGIEIMDLLPSFSQWQDTQEKELYLPGDGHWNATGHRLAADHVASELLRRRLVKEQKDY